MKSTGHDYTSDGQQTPNLAEPFKKNAESERFLARLNSTLAPLEDQEYLDLPEQLPTLFVLGVPRSGTTLLTQLIGSHLNVHYINNLVAAFWRAPMQGIKLSRKLLADSGGSSYRSRLGRTRELHEPHEFGYFWSHHLRYPNMHEPQPDHERDIDWAHLRKVLINITRTYSGPVVYKPFLLTWHLSRMHALMSRACFVWMRRDPVDTAVSIIHARASFFGSREQWLSLLPRACVRYRSAPCWQQAAAQFHFVEEAIRNQFSTMATHRIQELDYESVCADPRDAMARIATLLNNNGGNVSLQGEPPRPFRAVRHRDVPSPLVCKVRQSFRRFQNNTSGLEATDRC